MAALGRALQVGALGVLGIVKALFDGNRTVGKQPAHPAQISRVVPSWYKPGGIYMQALFNLKLCMHYIVNLHTCMHNFAWPANRSCPAAPTARPPPAVSSTPRED